MAVNLIGACTVIVSILLMLRNPEKPLTDEQYWSFDLPTLLFSLSAVSALPVVYYTFRLFFQTKKMNKNFDKKCMRKVIANLLFPIVVMVVCASILRGLKDKYTSESAVDVPIEFALLYGALFLLQMNRMSTFFKTTPVDVDGIGTQTQIA